MKGDVTPAWLHIIVLSLAGMALIVATRMMELPEGFAAGGGAAVVYFWLTFGSPAFSKWIRQNG
jgi:hypothetical protein